MQAATSEKEQNVDFSGVPIEALESLRLRLTQLTHSLNKLQTEMKSAQMSNWVSIQSQVNIIFTQLASLSATLSTYSETLSKTVVYPLPEFPTTEQESLLTTLLRKKPLPEVTDWIEESKQKSTDILLKDDEALTQWALSSTVDQRKGYEFKGFHTKKELEAGDTEDNDFNVMGAPGVNQTTKYSVDELLKLMYQGTVPEH
ncbi:hypothetical protein WICANDRAFT_107083 [Wickerhamomyces anomalus NRRL Y-366-8]|uniref:Mediator of RNA polymerase II transcription subunit 8 n=1 Tax=Wickerhamomyces anomalus (strain ATCC 58044 / CBS 1984 / NCYC 433 / NRRL Y-366-8) TaxID=683960 RepID=A0A1E3NWN4_WICAA|nr:uncharacterized protein WICANDRAFT_107083 [Wickerhamomyces anomalus NRRL Y-366-8]ODQ57591.1 hypothetical protein WICANDRAFT_107083 [Wickerhamomyces anomalus NRRL Y-366-8]